MKKITFVILFLLLFTTAYSKERLFTFQAGISTGGAVYSDSETQENDKSVGNFLPFNFGANLEININAAPEVSFFAGSDVFMTFNAESPLYSNHINVLFPFGIKIYPHLKGLCFGIAYAPSYRQNYFNLKDSVQNQSVSGWGNGLKLLLEYNSSKNKDFANYPVLGFAWHYSPRKNNCHDHLFSFYVKANF